jgi:outer membrane immunogenic protein
MHSLRGGVVKKLLLTGVAFVALTTSPAMAVDYRAVALYNWTGTYVGIAGGGAWGKSDQSDSFGLRGPTGLTGATGPAGPPGPPGDGDYRVRGWLLGGALGYNEQIGHMVFGIEADLSYARVQGDSLVCGVASPHQCGTSLHSLGTLRTRMGPSWGAWFLYLTGGLAFGEVSAFDNLFAVSGSEWRIGWTLGGGAEVMFTPNWSMKIEYLHVDLGTAPRLFDIVPGFPERVHFDAEVARVALNYRLNWGVPPVIVK